MKNTPNSKIFSGEEIKNQLKNLSDSIRYVILNEHITVQNLQEQLITLYKTPWCDPVYLNMLDSSVLVNMDCSKLFLYENDILKHIILFKYNRKVKHINILNHYFKTSMQDIETIRNIIFDEYKNVKKITFPYLRFEKVEKKPLMTLYEQHTDKIIELPESMSDYMKLLGASTRKNIHLYQNRIAKQIPDYKMTVIEGENISREQITSLVELNRSRMKSKGKTCENNDAEIDIYYRYARIRGVVCLGTVNDTIISGTINFVFKDHVYFYVIAHDNAYNKFRAGQIALVGTIQNMIERKMKYFHCLWGDEDYKQRLGGIPHALYDVTFFRKRMDFFMTNILLTVRTLKKKSRKRIEKIVILKKIYRKLHGA